MSTKILNEIEESLKELVRETDEKYDNFLNEKVYKVYHGTNQQFNKFDFKRATQGIVWFTDSIDSIKNQEHGGAGNKFIMTRYITINKPAGWAEYEKYGLQQLEDMGYDGVILPQGDKTDYFVFSNKNISAKGPKELGERKMKLPIMRMPMYSMNEDMSWEQQKYPDIYNEFNALDEKQLDAKIKELHDEFSRLFRLPKDDVKEKEVAVKMNVAEKIKEERKKNAFDNTLNKIISQPFLGTTIEHIIFPDMSEDGKWDTFYLHLADENSFEYRAGKFPEFAYYSDAGGWKTQDLRRPVEPKDAILSSKELQLLNLIVRLNNTTFKKKEYPRNAVTTDGTNVVQAPQIQTQDLQWMVGKGGSEHKITSVRVSNETGKDSYGGGFILVYIGIDEDQYHGLNATHYTYYVNYDPFYKVTAEEMKQRGALSRNEIETTSLHKDVYDDIMKGIQQVNPQTKIFKTISEY